MNEIDFLPRRITAQRERRHRLVVQGYLLAICLIGLIVLGYVFHGRIEKARGELQLLQSRAGSIHRQLELRGSLEGQLGDLMIKKRIEEQLGRRAGTLEVLAELQRVVPESMALTSLTMATVTVRAAAAPAAGREANRAVAKGKAKTRRTVKRVRVVITGMAPSDVDVANFIGQLSASPVFEDVTMGYAKNVDFRSRSARKFQASCYVAR